MSSAMVRIAMASVMQGHVVSVQLECTCATHSGMYACSNTKRRTVMICMMSFSMKSVGMAMMAMMGAMKGKCWCGMLHGIGVSLYHVEACMFGCQQRLFVVRPNTIVLPTSHAHNVAEMTKKTCI